MYISRIDLENVLGVCLLWTPRAQVIQALTTRNVASLISNETMLSFGDVIVGADIFKMAIYLSSSFKRLHVVEFSIFSQ